VGADDDDVRSQLMRRVHDDLRRIAVRFVPDDA
jgi:hypothetical protein